MQRQFEDIEVQLWEYLDGICSKEDKLHIEQLIATDEVWQKKHAELQLFQQQLGGIETQQPSMRFTANVMDDIAGSNVAGTTAAYLNNWVIKCIAAFFVLALTSAITYSIMAIDWTTGDGGSLSIQKFMKSEVLQVVMFINILLALLIIDRFVRKRNTGRTVL